MHNRHGGFTNRGTHARLGKQRITRAALALLALMSLLVLAPGFTSAQTSSSGAVRSLVTTGAIGTNSNALTVANAAGFQVGDWVIVEIGKEPGKGLRGTRGVGGTWPSRSFPTVQAMNAASGPQGQFVWVEPTGVVYERIGGQWKVPWPPAYYTAKALPKSLQARITAIKGNTLTLDKSAVLGVSGANVYLDVAPVINKMIVDAPSSVTIPAGNYAIGGTLWVLEKSGFTFAGSGKGRTRFYSPKGFLRHSWKSVPRRVPWRKISRSRATGVTTGTG